MTDGMKAARKAEIKALDEELIDKERKIYEAYGLSYPHIWKGCRDGWRPPELKDLRRYAALKLKDIQEKYKD